MKLAEEVLKIVTDQSYQKKPLIAGVKIVELKRHLAEDGAFAEIVRFERGKIVAPEEFRGFVVAQVNHSLMVPGTVKAWHLHQLQDEIWFVHPSACLIAGLLDVRTGSKTKNLTMRLSLGGGRACLLYIPCGVAHGLSNPYFGNATMTYLVSRHFDGSDEKRLPFDFGVNKDFWEIKKG